MEERLALTVASEDELRDRLARFVETGTAGAGIFRGTLPKGTSTIPAVPESGNVLHRARRSAIFKPLLVAGRGEKRLTGSNFIQARLRAEFRCQDTLF